MQLFQIESHKMYTEQPEQSIFVPHAHDFFELFCFLSGNALYSVEGNIYSLSPGDIIVLRNAEMHYLILRKSTPYMRFSIYFKPDHGLSREDQAVLLAPFMDRSIGLYNHYQASQFRDRHWVYYLEQLCQTDEPLRQQIYLSTILRELADCFPLVKENVATLYTDNIIKVTHFIDSHLTQSLSLDEICDRFYISKAQLTRNFKRNLGTTVGDYIITKRLLLARSMILDGQNPTNIYLQCGFHDYSAFFKAYKKKFGYTPKNTNKYFIDSEEI